MSQRRRVLAFDIYGTILDTSSVSSTIQEQTSIAAEKVAQITSLWRKYQLEYTWRLNSMGLYEPFDIVTRQSLEQAALEVGHRFEDTMTEEIMHAYMRLKTFDDAVPALEALREVPTLELVVFSNGTTEMISTALKAALPESLVPMPMFLADWVKIYKPARAIYDSLLTHLSLLGQRDTQRGPGQSSDVWLVSGNPFDVTGARSAGMGAIWVDRAGQGWTDRLPLDETNMGPMKIVRGLEEIPSLFTQ